MIPFSVEWESKLWELRDSPDARAAFLEESGCTSALPKIIVQGYKVRAQGRGRGSGVGPARRRPCVAPRLPRARRGRGALQRQAARPLARSPRLRPAFQPTPPTPIRS
jgi:hypothetical protein